MSFRSCIPRSHISSSSKAQDIALVSSSSSFLFSFYFTLMPKSQETCPAYLGSAWLGSIKSRSKSSSHSHDHDRHSHSHSLAIEAYTTPQSIQQTTRSCLDDHHLPIRALGTRVTRIRRGRAARRMSRAGISDENGLFLDGVAALAVGGTGVDGVLEVDAFADGVAFDDFVAHFVGCGVRSCSTGGGAVLFAR